MVLLLACVYRVLGTPFWSVNGSRLMPSFALSHGVNYYVDLARGGPLYSTLYGPLVATVYLPATWFPTPNSAVLAGAAITVLVCFGAAAFLHFGRANAANTVAFLAAGLLICYLDPLTYSCFNIHADGPGLAFAAIACGTLYPERRSLPVSALCAVLAIFSKQMFVAVPIALLAYLLLAAGRKSAWRYLLWLTLAGGAAGAAAIAVWGFGPLYHCLIWLPSHHPWNNRSALFSWIQAGRQMIRLSMPVLVLLVAGAIYRWRLLAAGRAAPVLLVGIALVPFSILGRAKMGGDINSLSFATFFLTCGLTLLLADLARERLAMSTLLAILIALTAYEAPLAFGIAAKIGQLPAAPQQVAFRYLQRHPGEAYFPWFPLSHYEAEHKFRHYAFGIADRLMAGEDVSMQEFRAYVPRDPRIVALSADGSRDMLGYDLMQFLPAYDSPGTDPELPGWVVYRKHTP